MMTDPMTTAAAKTAECICGKRHRAGTVCEKAQRIELARVETQEVLEALRRLPSGTVVLLDGRRGHASARTLADGEVLVRRYADGCEDETWGAVAEGRDGAVRYQRDNGGFVPNGYRYRAETDELHVVAAEGRVVILVERVLASSRPYGKGSVVDRLPHLAHLRDAVRSGARYCLPWVAAVSAQARLERLLQRRLAGLSAQALSDAESVELDAAIELGAVFGDL